MNNPQPKVTISLVTFNNEKYIPYVLSSIAAQSFKDWELIILDNNSADETVKAIHEEALPYKLLEQRHNLGFGRGHNSIINWSAGEYILILNADVILEPNYLQLCIAYMDQHPEVATLSGKLLSWDFQRQEKTNIIDSCGLNIDRRYHVSNRLQGHVDSSKIQSAQVFGHSATAMLVRRSALQHTALPKFVGSGLEYFDEDFLAYKEDADLAWRLRLAGWEHYCLVTAVGYHHRAASSRRSSFKDRKNRNSINMLSYRNHLCMLKKNSFSSVSARNFLAILFYELEKFIYLSFLDQSSFTGLRQYFKLRARMSKKRKLIKKMTTIPAKDFQVWLDMNDDRVVKAE